MKSAIIEQIAMFLLKEGFTVKTLTGSCFDLLARKKDNILIIKALEDANAITQQYVEEMNRVAAYVQATPVVIAEKAGSKLEDNVLYSRFDLYTLNVQTFINSIKNKFPFIKRTQAGLTASIDSNKLKQKREELGYSINALSKKVGVSSKMIVRYEQGNSEITITKAQKLFDIFGGSVFKNLNIFKHYHETANKQRSNLSKKYASLGFEASDTKKTPFDIIAKKDHELILTEVGDKSNPDLKSLARLLDADKLIIFKKKKPKDIPALTKEEFLEFEKANELIRFVKE